MPASIEAALIDEHVIADSEPSDARMHGAAYVSSSFGPVKPRTIKVV